MCLSRLISSGFNCDDNSTTWNLTKIGVSEQLVTKFIGSEYSNAQALFDATVDHCEQSIINTAVTHVMPQIQANSVIDSRVIGDKYDGTRAAVAKMGGFVFESEQNRGDLSVGLQINRVSIQVDYTGDIDLIVYNHTDGVQVASETVSVVAGVTKEVELDVEVKSMGRQLKVSVGYDRTGIAAYTYKMHHDCTSCKKAKCGMYMYGYGAQWEDDNTDITRTGHTAGLSIDYSLACNYERVVCSNKHLFGEAFLYKVASEIMAYGITSVRWNDTDLEKLEKKLSFFGDNYDRLIKQAIHGMRLPNNECFGCRKRFGTKTMTP